MSPVETLAAFLDRIDRQDAALNAFIGNDRQGARAAAREAGRGISEGQ